ncbi:hypothetical protein Tco_1088440 [Tanacetum coccineum]
MVKASESVGSSISVAIGGWIVSLKTHEGDWSSYMSIQDGNNHVTHHRATVVGRHTDVDSSSLEDYVSVWGWGFSLGRGQIVYAVSSILHTKHAALGEETDCEDVSNGERDEQKVVRHLYMGEVYGGVSSRVCLLWYVSARTILKGVSTLVFGVIFYENVIGSARLMFEKSFEKSPVVTT